MTIKEQHRTEMTEALSLSILTAEQEKTYGRSIEIARILETLPANDHNAPETTMALIMRVCRIEPTVRTITKQIPIAAPPSLRGIMQCPELRELIDRVISNELAARKSDEYKQITDFSALCELIPPATWEIAAELLEGQDIEGIQKQLEHPETLLYLLDKQAYRLALHFRSIRKEAEEARDQMFQRNTRLVRQIANKYQNNGVEFEDLFQEGCAGLVKAIEKFDHHSGYKFSTYATWWIRQAITRAIADLGRTIRVPVHMVEKINKIRRVSEAIERNGSSATPEAIAEFMEISLEEIKATLRISHPTISIDQEINYKNSNMEASKSTLADIIPDETQNTENKAINQQVKTEIREAMQNLTERDRSVLELRFGLSGHEPMTLEQVGQIHGLTRERIRQLEAKAIKKLKPYVSQMQVEAFT